MPFLPHNQQRQSTEGIFELVLSLNHNCCLTVVALGQLLIQTSLPF